MDKTTTYIFLVRFPSVSVILYSIKKISDEKVPHFDLQRRGLHEFFNKISFNTSVILSSTTDICDEYKCLVSTISEGDLKNTHFRLDSLISLIVYYQH